MQTAEERTRAKNKTYLWKFRGESILVSGKEIIYLHTEQRKVYVHTVRGVYRIGGSLKEAVKEVEGLPMVKTHASYLVSMDHLQRISRHDAVLKNGETLPVSERCWQRIKPVVQAYARECGWKKH